MKTQQEIEKLAQEVHYQFQNQGLDENGCFNQYQGFIKGYTQCQKDNDWTKGCGCENSIGQTWCCNQCGLPYDTRKSYKKYTEDDIRNAIQVGISAEAGDYPKGWSYKLGISLEDYFINSLNEQDLCK